MSHSIKWHINPENGKPGRCGAQYNCRFKLSEEEHYGSREDAQEAYEKSHNGSFNDAILKKNMKDTTPPAEEEMTRKSPAGVPLSTYIKEDDFIAYRGNVIKVGEFKYNRARLGYEIFDASGEETFVPDRDWYEESSISMLPREKYNVEDFDKEVHAKDLNIGDPFTTDRTNDVYHFVRRDYNSYYDTYKTYVEELDTPLEDQEDLEIPHDECIEKVFVRPEDR